VEAAFHAQPGDLLVLAGRPIKPTWALSELRLEMGQRLGLRGQLISALWVVGFRGQIQRGRNRYFASATSPA
jgi:aspartyl-tRNA synthetase